MTAGRRGLKAAAEIVIPDREGNGTGEIICVIASILGPAEATAEELAAAYRRELLDRTLIWNQRHLMIVLREYEDFYNPHRPHTAP